MCFIGSLCVFKVGFLDNNERKNGNMARRFAFVMTFLCEIDAREKREEDAVL